MRRLTPLFAFALVLLVIVGLTAAQGDDKQPITPPIIQFTPIPPDLIAINTEVPTPTPSGTATLFATSTPYAATGTPNDGALVTCPAAFPIDPARITPQYFREEFDDGALPVWRFSGAWAIAPAAIGSRLLVASDGSPALAESGQSLDDQLVSFRLTVESGGAGAEVRRSEAGAYRVILTADGVAQVSRSGVPLCRALLPSLTERSGAGGLSTPGEGGLPGMEVEIWLIGGMLTLIVEGTPILTAIDPSPLPPGTVTLVADPFTRAGFDELLLNTVEPEPVQPNPTYAAGSPETAAQCVPGWSYTFSFASGQAHGWSITNLSQEATGLRASIPASNGNRSGHVSRSFNFVDATLTQITTMTRGAAGWYGGKAISFNSVQVAHCGRWYYRANACNPPQVNNGLWWSGSVTGPMQMSIAVGENALPGAFLGYVTLQGTGTNPFGPSGTQTTCPTPTPTPTPTPSATPTPVPTLPFCPEGGQGDSAQSAPLCQQVTPTPTPYTCRVNARQGELYSSLNSASPQIGFIGNGTGTTFTFTIIGRHIDSDQLMWYHVSYPAGSVRDNAASPLPAGNGWIRSTLQYLNLLGGCDITRLPTTSDANVTLTPTPTGTLTPIPCLAQQNGNISGPDVLARYARAEIAGDTSVIEANSDVIRALMLIQFNHFLYGRQWKLVSTLGGDLTAPYPANAPLIALTIAQQLVTNYCQSGENIAATFQGQLSPTNYNRIANKGLFGNQDAVFEISFHPDHISAVESLTDHDMVAFPVTTERAVAIGTTSSIDLDFQCPSGITRYITSDPNNNGNVLSLVPHSECFPPGTCPNVVYWVITMYNGFGQPTAAQKFAQLLPGEARVWYLACEQ